MKSRGLFIIFNKGLSLIVILSFFFDVAGVTLFNVVLLIPRTAEAATVVIDANPSTTASAHTSNGANVVFTSDQVGYKFYRYGTAPYNGACVYNKTTNGGDTWGSAVVFDTQSDCIGISVWYDKWTPDDSGDYIHMVTIDTSADEMYYNRLDTTSDTLLLATSVSANLGGSGTYVAGTNYTNITKGTNGKLYAVTDDAGGTNIRSCTSSCNLSASWSGVGTPPQGNADSWSQMLPLIGGNIMLINRSTSNQIRHSTWNGSTWTTIQNIDAAAIRNTTYDVGMAATVNTTTGDLYLVYVADNNDFVTADHDIRSALYSGGSWSATTDLLTNTSKGLLQVGIARDLNNGNLYVGYTARATLGTANTANVYWKRSTDGMTTWGTEQGPVNAVAGDFYGMDMNIMNDERIYATWYDNVGSQDLFGNTIADIGPELKLDSIGTQKTQARAGTLDLYLGGTFSLRSLSSQTVSTVILTESGTVHAQDNIKNVKIQYEFDTSSPYDCVSESYAGSESQFGSTIASGFSGADGVAAFTNAPLSVTPTQTMCMYAVFDLQSTAGNGNTIEVSVNYPPTDVLVSGGFTTKPLVPVLLAGTTTIVDPNLTQSGYHWRLDNGSETTASSATSGTENTPLTALQIGAPRRLRIGVANQGSTSTLPSTYSLEYGEASPTCVETSSWFSVGTGSAVWNLSNSVNITDGANTTNILVASGGVTDLGSSFVATNAALRDATNTTGSMTLGLTNFFEAEYSIVASSTAAEGSTYCFRLTNAGTPLSVYSQIPRVTIAADVLVQTFGTQIATVNAGNLNTYSGGGFSLTENTALRNVTSIKLTELGTIDSAVSLENLKLFYENDITAPYDCLSESYAGTELQYGTTLTSGFSDPGETAIFTDGGITISTVSGLCLYLVYDALNSTPNSQTIDIAIATPSTDVVVSGGATIGPSGLLNISGETSVQGAILTQTGYHWRNDDGSQTAATSATGGSENTTIEDFNLNTPIRLRLGVTNTGTVSSAATRFRLEYSPKITTCSAASVWTDVNAAADGWDMFNSTFLTNGETTTNIAVANGGVSNGVGSFIGTNGAVRDTESRTATTTVPSNDYLDLEYSITSTIYTSNNTTYCFRATSDGTAFNTYDQYAEIKTTPKRDFKVQRGSVQITGTSTIITAGFDYTAPSSSTSAFVRITNSQYTGAGHNTGSTVAQNADDITAYISNPENLTTSFTINRTTTGSVGTYVDWEIVEFIGTPSTDNQMIVRGVGTRNFTSSTLVATGTVLGNVTDNNDIVVFITGVRNNNTSRNYYAGQVTSGWDTTSQAPVFRRGATGSSIIDVSYAVVEFVGDNWNVQRAEHAYTAAGVIETESITAVNSLARTFIHAQKRMGASTNIVHYGHEVWLSSIGAVSFRLETGASVVIEQTSVAWVIENIQSGLGSANIQRSNGITTGGSAPLALSVVLLTPMAATNNTSIMANSRAAGVNTNYPRPQAGFTITSTSTYQIFRSNTGSALTYRVEIVEWPVADLAIRQNYYRFYVDNDLLTPTDPWPVGVSDLGENTSITANDEPLGIGEKIRVRMTLKTSNATMPAGLLNFKLQYGLRVTTCSAVSGGSWSDVGGISSGAVWRGFAASTGDGTTLSTDPPTGGDLLISIADSAGSLVHENPSAANPYSVDVGNNIEYDWNLEQNGATPLSTYCFRAIRSDGTPLANYNNYPQIRTVGFTPAINNWRWYSDINNETPVSPLSAETVSPINIANNDMLALRVSVLEKRNVQGNDIKFKLQFSEDVNFANPIDVVSTTTCQERSIWCYAEGVATDNQLISTRLLTGGSSCVSGIGSGCGRHNTSPDISYGHVHIAGATQEYEFTIRHVAARVNAVYYFRLYDISIDAPVSLNTSLTNPSLVTEGSSLQLSLAGLPIGTTTAGVVTDISTTATGIGFGSLLINTEHIGAHRITVETNATEGYQLLSFARQQLLSSLGISIPSVTGTNITPLSWSSSCNASSTGCFGYHATDPTLKDGSTRFAPTDTYAGLETSPVEIMYSSIPATDIHDIVYRIKVNELQPAGDYETEVVYLAVPSY